jgi:hypothetical protein
MRTAAAAACVRSLRAQNSRIDVAAVERDRILQEAKLVLVRTPASPEWNNSFLAFSSEVAVLTAAFLLDRDVRYAAHAADRLAYFSGNAFVSDSVNLKAPSAIELLPLVEIARALPFLADSGELLPAKLASVRTAFAATIAALNNTANGLLARDARDHNASAWLLVNAALARAIGDEATLTACRHRFRQPTLRNQISFEGKFPHEVASTNPLRNSLFNFDLLAAVCESLATPFSSQWTVELEDGPGMRAAAAFLVPLLAAPAHWPFPADAEGFRTVPLRRPALLFAGRAYTRPEYVELWRSLPAPSPAERLSATFPIREPLLWVTRAPHAA